MSPYLCGTKWLGFHNRIFTRGGLCYEALPFLITGGAMKINASLSMFKKLTSILLILGALLVTSGCAINRATALQTPGTDMSKVKVFYVVKSSEDKRDVDKLIKDQLVKMGFTATSGPEMPPYKADAVVTYKDKWFWDITMYMLELTITLKNPTNNFPMAVGNSYHTSLTRKSPEEMVEEVLTNIFNSPKQVSTRGGTQ